MNGLRGDKPLIRDTDWLNEYIWQVKSYKPLKNGKYEVRLVEVQPAYDRDLEQLCETFVSTTYSSFNAYYLKDGVGCQGMACYIADWCERNAYPYSVAWSTTHVWIYVEYDSQWYLFDFGPKGPVFKEVGRNEVQKGLVKNEHS